MRKFFLRVHQIIGVMVALIIMVMGLTGSYLVWSREITPVVYSYTHQLDVDKPDYTLDKTVNFLTESYPSLRLTKIVLPLQKKSPLRLILNDAQDIRQEIYFDFEQEKVLNIYGRNNTYDPFLHRLHTELLGGNIGKFILGLLGICLLILSLTGIFLWKGWKRFRMGFKVRWLSKPQVINYDLHQFIGIFSFILVANMAITGSILAFEQPINKLFSPSNLETVTVNNQSLMVNNNTNLSSLDSLLREAKHITGENNFTEVKFVEERDIIEFRFKQGYDINPRGRSYISFNGKTGELLNVDKFSEKSFYQRFRVWSDVFHYGILFGIFSMGVYFVFGFVLVGLSLTGFLIWIQKKKFFFTKAK
ncbi:PepSY domain-containing protein [Cyanobacterium stanieri LEGE 03274]|uniref:PepSY domain-containing protein n=1 Tax=Cyanobacterium stanieri LEGE 03274 TaxID=1828756 RepID=A0ABR9V4I1_9CHRO|nr:PepSY-associated TM helix domain-containing protein [Cyanobacterium stanieri]MBE9222788.1 PepSY domain-containing protein [Cyanobacterium stanieri LEGE 03274]